jgi:hypothetical protein
MEPASRRILQNAAGGPESARGQMQEVVGASASPGSAAHVGASTMVCSIDVGVTNFEAGLPAGEFTCYMPTTNVLVHGGLPLLEGHSSSAPLDAGRVWQNQLRTRLYSGRLSIQLAAAIHRMTIRIRTDLFPRQCCGSNCPGAGGGSSWRGGSKAMITWVP